MCLESLPLRFKGPPGHPGFHLRKFPLDVSVGVHNSYGDHIHPRYSKIAIMEFHALNPIPIAASFFVHHGISQVSRSPFTVHS